MRPDHAGVVLVADVRALLLHGHHAVAGELAGPPVPRHDPVQPVPARGLGALVGADPLDREDLVLDLQVVGRRVVDRRGELGHGRQQLLGRRRPEAEQLVVPGPGRRFRVHLGQPGPVQRVDLLTPRHADRPAPQAAVGGEPLHARGLPPVRADAGAAPLAGQVLRGAPQRPTQAATPVRGMDRDARPREVLVVPLPQVQVQHADEGPGLAQHVGLRGLAVPAVPQPTGVPGERRLVLERRVGTAYRLRERDHLRDRGGVVEVHPLHPRPGRLVPLRGKARSRGPWHGLGHDSSVLREAAARERFSRALGPCPRAFARTMLDRTPPPGRGPQWSRTG